MDIHKPKAAHSWREFLIEIGTIICGILIALGLEQGLEALHWRERMETTRDVLHAEIRENLGAVAARGSQQQCVERRLNELELIFQRYARRKPLALQGRIGRPMFYSGSLNAWKMAVADQTVAHMPYPERLAISRAYDNYEGFNQLLTIEAGAWSRIAVLDHPETLGPSDWSALHLAYADAVTVNSRIQNVVSFVLAKENLGQSPERLQLPEGAKAAGAQFCTRLVS